MNTDIGEDRRRRKAPLGFLSRNHPPSPDLGAAMQSLAWKLGFGKRLNCSDGDIDTFFWKLRDCFPLRLKCHHSHKLIEIRMLLSDREKVGITSHYVENVNISTLNLIATLCLEFKSES